MLTKSDITPAFPFEIREESFSIASLDGRYEFDFDIRLNCGANLQREFCWDSEQKNALLETILMGYSTIGSVLFIETFNPLNPHKDKTEVIDGKHRIMTILEFYTGKTPYIHNGTPYFYQDLDEEIQRRFMNTKIPKFYVSEERFIIANYGFRVFNNMTEDNLYKYRIQDDDKVRLFELFSYKGTPQTKEHLQNLKQQVNIV